jgi:hypothetical protein
LMAAVPVVIGKARILGDGDIAEYIVGTRSWSDSVNRL